MYTFSLPNWQQLLLVFASARKTLWAANNVCHCCMFDTPALDYTRVLQYWSYTSYLSDFNFPHVLLLIVDGFFLQCFDAVGWSSAKASGLFVKLLLEKHLLRQ